MDQSRLFETYQANKQRTIGLSKVEASWFSKLKASKIGLSVVALAAILTGIAAFTETLDKIATSTHLKPDALQIAKADEKEKFSRELTKAIWYRLHLSRTVLIALTNPDVPEAEKTKIWDRYQTTFDEWNRDFMVNILSLGQYYSQSKRAQFEHFLEPKFDLIDRCLRALRRSSDNDGCGSFYLEKKDALYKNELYKQIYELKEGAYCFISGLPDKQDNLCFFDRTSISSRRG